jgi:hypothetical protein
MKASKFTELARVDAGGISSARNQKVFVIKQGEEGTSLAETCRKVCISQANYFNWKQKYTGLAWL